MCLQRYTFCPTLFPMYVDLYRIIESLNATVSIPVLTENMMQQKVFEFTVDKRKKKTFFTHIFSILDTHNSIMRAFTQLHTIHSKLVRKVVYCFTTVIRSIRQQTLTSVLMITIFAMIETWWNTVFHFLCKRFILQVCVFFFFFFYIFSHWFIIIFCLKLSVPSTFFLLLC